MGNSITIEGVDAGYGAVRVLSPLWAWAPLLALVAAAGAAWLQHERLAPRLASAMDESREIIAETLG